MSESIVLERYPAVGLIASTCVREAELASSVNFALFDSLTLSVPSERGIAGRSSEIALFAPREAASSTAHSGRSIREHDIN